MTYSYIVGIQNLNKRFIYEMVCELGNFSSPSEIVIEGLSKIYSDALRSGIIKEK